MSTRVTTFYQGTACRNCGCTERYARNRNCVACVKARTKAQRRPARNKATPELGKPRACVCGVLLPPRAWFCKGDCKARVMWSVAETAVAARAAR